ncbi:flagellar biosynthesis protein FliQ [Thiospirillum jenense]|uniref:Flagellar biosynthetic protein FliQ n=1 Tax=Thiospirillum jenense TaxID=1653858 RepID=A0A839HI10_9GAMM|nr:flagellar biosynthesis protein FliQ [Thiospirillum jenense]MBB1125772.1 flagellar biosynthesis protein FliQ [Thiospirillum jenense]
MSPELVVDIGQDAAVTVMLVAAPVLLIALGIGIIIGMIQAATQIQEMTLTFIPKLVGIFVTFVLFGHWMLTTMTDYTTKLYATIPTLVG